MVEIECCEVDVFFLHEEFRTFQKVDCVPKLLFKMLLGHPDCIGWAELFRLGERPVVEFVKNNTFAGKVDEEVLAIMQKIADLASAMHDKPHGCLDLLVPHQPISRLVPVLGIGQFLVADDDKNVEVRAVAFRRVVKGDALAYEQLTSRLSRSGAKETTLDYISDFAERRGIASDRWIVNDQGIGQEFGVKSEIELASAQDERQEVLSRAAHLQREQQDRPSERQQVYEERAGDLAGPVHREGPRNQFARTIDDGRRDDRIEDSKGYRRIRWSDLMSQDSAVPAPTEAIGQQLPTEPGKPTPLVPAITRHHRSIEEVARKKAMSVIDHRFDTVESLARHVFRDPVEVTARLRTAMTEKEGNGNIMAKAMAEQPERFGELRGKSGLFGNNRERKEALRYARSLSAHIGYVSEAWERRLGEERQSEQWQREKRDVIEVPSLTRRSAEILSEVEKMPVEKRSQFISELRSSPEGRAAIDEAKLVVDALTRRFGSSDPRRSAEELAARPDLAKQAEHIRTIAGMVHRTRHAELSHDHTLKRQLNRSQGLGFSR